MKDIRRREIIDLLEDVADSKGDGRRKPAQRAPISANRLAALISRLFNLRPQPRGYRHQPGPPPTPARHREGERPVRIFYVRAAKSGVWRVSRDMENPPARGRRVSVPGGGPAQGAGALCLWTWTFLITRSPPRDLTAEISGFSQVPGWTLLCTCPGLIHPGGPSTLGHWAPRILPSAGATTSAPQSQSLEADYHGLHTRCLRFAARGYPIATQDSLPLGGQPLAGRIRTY